jgi:diguanylate cyclase (GGDEF)-like protein/PAS domain S-box-containing protein
VTAAPIPDNEGERLAALRRYMLLDTVPEPEFDRITALAAKLFDVPIALVSLVDADRQWFKSCIGLDATQTDRDVAFCAHALFDAQPLVVQDALADVRFAYNPLVTGDPFIRFYAGAPLVTREGFALGTLCIIDRKPRTLTREQVETLVSLSQVVVDLVEARLGYRSREMFEKVADLSPNVMYIFDLGDKKNVFANRRFVDLIGYPPANDGGQLVERIFHPEDAQNAELHFRRMLTLKDDEVARLRFRVKAASGEYRVFDASETVFERDANGKPCKTLGVANDVTTLKRIQDEAAAKTRLLETVLRNAGEGILAVDRAGQVTLSNKVAHEILGIGDKITTPEERKAAYGVFDLDGETEIPQEELPLGRALRGEVTEGKEMILRTNARPMSRYLIATGRPMVDEQGNSIGGVITFRDVTQLKKAQHALAELAVTDDLTALPNKRALRERLGMLSREGGRGRKFAVVVTDVDFFKKVNDTYGHKTGDEVLAVVGQTLRSSVRSTDFVARYGGEEFVVLYTDVDEQVGATLADKLRAAIASIEKPVKITASFGVCANTADFASDGDALIKAADAALYRAKHAGRNRVVRYHQPTTED